MEREPTVKDAKFAKSFVRYRNLNVRVENAQDTCEASITGNAKYMALQGIGIVTGILDAVHRNRFAAHVEGDLERSLSYEMLEQHAVDILTK